MLSHKKSLIEKYLSPFIGEFKNVNPNLLTLLGIIPSILFFVFMINNLYVLAFVAFLGTALDILDGMVARKYNKVTKFGGFIDSTFDRISDFLIISSFAFAGIVVWEIVAPLLFFSFLTSYIRSRGEQINSAISFAIGIIERTERLALILVSLILYMIFSNIILIGLNIAEIVFLVLLTLSIYTVTQRIIYAYKNQQ